MTRCAEPRTRKVTSQMSAVDLARVVAHNREWRQDGGWIFAGDLPLAQGYWSLAEKLQALGIVIPGAGINWPRLDKTRAERIKMAATRL